MTEWVVVLSRGKNKYLTDRQYEFYKANRHKGSVCFPGFEINPSFVVQIYRREIKQLKKMYPCPKCKGTGISGASFCKSCNKTGLNKKILKM